MYLTIHTYWYYVGTCIDNICAYAHIPLHTYMYFTYFTGIMYAQLLYICNTSRTSILVDTFQYLPT